MAFYPPPAKLNTGTFVSPAPFVTSSGVEMEIDTPSGPAIPHTTTTPDRPRATLVIPIDGERVMRRTPSQKSLLRRDSLKRREALVKGKEGSRRRQRWENDNLLSNPHATPPTPQDWVPTPVYAQKTIRYEVAQLWEHPTFRKTVLKPNERLREEKRAHSHIDGVPRLLKERIKKSGKGAVEIVRNLEEEVRAFVVGGTMREEAERDGFVVVERDREVVVEEKAPGKRVLQKPVLETEESDPGATFGRWLVHSIAKYYGLHSWSVTVGDGESPGKRIAYVGMLEGHIPGKKHSRRKSKDVAADAECTMPKPLWGML